MAGEAPCRSIAVAHGVHVPPDGRPHLVELQDAKLDLLVLVLELLGLGVGLFLALLGASQEASKAVEGGLLLNAAEAQEIGILQLLAVEDNTLLIAANS